MPMGEHQISIDVISKNLIFLDKDFNSRNQVLEHIALEALKNEYITNKEDFLQAILAREEEISTAIGYLIAIPHGKTDAAKRPFIAFMRLNKEIAWEANQDEPVKLIFLIGVPESEYGKLHLKFISQLSKKLLDEDFRNKLLKQADTENVYQQLTSIEI